MPRATGSRSVSEVTPPALPPGEPRNAVGREDTAVDRSERQGKDQLHHPGSNDRISNGRQARASASPRNSARITPRYSTANQPLWGSPSHSPGFSTVSADLISTVQSRPDQIPGRDGTPRPVARACAARPRPAMLGRPFPTHCPSPSQGSAVAGGLCRQARSSATSALIVEVLSFPQLDTTKLRAGKCQYTKSIG